MFDFMLQRKLMFAFVNVDEELEVEFGPGCGWMSLLRLFSRIDGLKEAIPLAEYGSRLKQIASISFLYAMISVQNGRFGKNS